MNSKRKKKTSDAVQVATPDYDGAWKDLIEQHFEPFLEFFFPQIHKDIDFSKKIEILSKELRRIIPRSKVGRRYSDVLVKVHLKDGTHKFICVFIHVEVQGTRDSKLMERLFIYYYRIFDKHRAKGNRVVSLLVLTDDDPKYRPKWYRFKLWGFELRLIIPFVKITDYLNIEALAEKIKISTSPMALVVKVILDSFKAKKGDDNSKYNVKLELIRQLYRHGYAGDYIRSLLSFIDMVICLPEPLEVGIEEEIFKFEEEQKMAYVTSWERLAEKRAKLAANLQTAIALLNYGVSLDIASKSTGLSKEEIQKEMEKTTTTDSTKK